MSFFLATIPAGTELYHGRGSNATVKGFEWLAFEPEHAMNFAAKGRTRSRSSKAWEAAARSVREPSKRARL